jgi:dihydrofolate synthase/folylpolyglutamate synthase
VPPPSARASLLALEQFGIKLGLDQIRALLERLDHPDRAYPAVIVAGTNGKGSVTAMIERGLRAAGYRTGRYTSPHLVDLEERFAINGTAIASRTLDESTARVLVAAADLSAPPSFFEATTAIALDIFRRERIDVAVLEVGLGGRLDATNVVEATAAVITPIDFDHEQYLGQTLEAIAREKAGVIKSGALVVLAANPGAVENVVSEVCRGIGASLVRAVDGVLTDIEMVDGHAHLTLTTPVRAYGRLRVALAGRHQAVNATTAIRFLESLAATRGFQIGREDIAAGVEQTIWPARLETIRVSSIDVLLDGAHNPAGARALAGHVLETFGRGVPMVVGAMRDKALAGLVSALAPAASHFVFTAASTSRAAPASELAAVARRVAPGVPSIVEAQPVRAVRMAAEHGTPVVVAGSLYLAGEVRAART